MKFAIYGIGCLGEKVYQRMDHLEGEIAYFVQTKKSQDYFHGYEVRSVDKIMSNEFDILIIAVADYCSVHNVLKKIPNNSEIIKKIRNISQIDYICGEPDLVMPYKSVKLRNGIQYISTTKDMVIGEAMHLFGKNYAEDQIQTFFELLVNCCNFDKNCEGIFFDIGANIGTTCIYAKKVLASNMKYIGFEAGMENYKLFKCNCILNEVEDIVVEKLALGEKKCKGRYLYSAENPGGSGVSFSDSNVSDIDVVSLDEYIKKNNINEGSVACIWLDTEGCEAEIIIGAKNLLDNRLPMMQEFNPDEYERRNKAKEYYEIIEKIYSHFIDVENKHVIYDIKEIRSYKDIMKQNNRAQADLFFY